MNPAARVSFIRLSYERIASTGEVTTPAVTQAFAKIGSDNLLEIFVSRSKLAARQSSALWFAGETSARPISACARRQVGRSGDRWFVEVPTATYAEFRERICPRARIAALRLSAAALPILPGRRSVAN